MQVEKKERNNHLLRNSKKKVILVSETKRSGIAEAKGLVKYNVAKLRECRSSQ